MKLAVFVLLAALTLNSVNALALDAEGPTPQSKRVAAEMAGAATAWLRSLDDRQRTQATAPLDSDLRYEWTPVPVQNRSGLPLRDMNAGQKTAAAKLLRAALSQRGALTVTAIMELETVLREIEGPRTFNDGKLIRDPELYNYLVYGDPESAAWAWRFEGHHVSIHTTVVAGQVVVTPVFLGSNPMEVASGPGKGTATLRDRQELGFAVLNALRADQRLQAIIGDEVFDLLQRDARQAEPLEPKGLCVCNMDAEQQVKVRRLLQGYLETLRDELAQERLATILKDGLDSVHFAWAGAQQPGRGHYYRLQGKSFVLEYDNSQNNANHVHSVWREFDRDFGRDLLQEHYRRSHRQ